MAPPRHRQRLRTQLRCTIRHGQPSRRVTITDQEMTGVAGALRAALDRYRL